MKGLIFFLFIILPSKPAKVESFIHLRAKALEISYCKDYPCYRDMHSDGNSRCVCKDDNGIYHTCDGNVVIVAKIVDAADCCENVKVTEGGRDINGEVLYAVPYSLGIETREARYFIKFTREQYTVIDDLKKQGAIRPGRPIQISLEIRKD